MAMTTAQIQWKLAYEQETEERRLRKNAWFVGVSMLAIVVIQQVAGALLYLLMARAKANMYDSTPAYLLYSGLQMAQYLLCIFVPVALCGLIFRRAPLPEKATRQKVNFADALLLIVFGMAVCIFANYIVNYWLQAIAPFGIEPFDGGYNNDEGLLPLALNLISYALLPALAEELVFRGWLLSALRPFGERRALLLSALLFGLAHGNLTQLPFAFMLGLLFAFLALRTGHLWIGMVIHFLNNGMSVVLDYANHNLGMTENETLLLQLTVFLTLSLLGALAGVIFRHHTSTRELAAPLCDRRSVVSEAKRSRIMWLNPAILAGMGIFGVLTVLAELLPL